MRRTETSRLLLDLDLDLYRVKDDMNDISIRRADRLPTLFRRAGHNILHSKSDRYHLPLLGSLRPGTGFSRSSYRITYHQREMGNMHQHPGRDRNERDAEGRNQTTNSDTSHSHRNRTNNDNDDPLNALSDHHITQLATLLRLPSSNQLITTSHQGWLTCQREEIANNLDPVLKRRRRGKLSCPVLPTSVRVHRSPKLCSSHRGLRPDIIAACSSQLRELWELGVEEFEEVLFGIENKRSINGLKRRSRDDWQKMLREYLEGLIRDVVGVGGLMVSERELRRRFERWYLKNNNNNNTKNGAAASDFGGVIWGREELDRPGEDNALFAGPEERPFRFIATGCEACVLATLGRGGTNSRERGKDGVDILAILKAALLVRYHRRKGTAGTGTGTKDGNGEGANEDEEIRLPGLFRLVEVWIKLADAEEDRGKDRMKDADLRLGDKVRHEHEHQDEERRPHPEGRQPQWRRRRERHTQRPQSLGGKQKVDNSQSGQDNHGELPLTPYLQQPQPKPQLRSRSQVQQKEQDPQHPRTKTSQQKLQQKPEQKKQPQRDQRRIHDDVDVSRGEKDDDDSVPTTIPFTRTTRKERRSGNKDKLPIVYAVISQLSVDPALYPREIARRRSGKGDLRGEFHSHDGGREP